MKSSFYIALQFLSCILSFSDLRAQDSPKSGVILSIEPFDFGEGIFHIQKEKTITSFFRKTRELTLFITTQNNRPEQPMGLAYSYLVKRNVLLSNRSGINWEAGYSYGYEIGLQLKKTQYWTSLPANFRDHFNFAGLNSSLILNVLDVRIDLYQVLSIRTYLGPALCWRQDFHLRDGTYFTYLPYIAPNLNVWLGIPLR